MSSEEESSEENWRRTNPIKDPFDFKIDGKNEREW